MKNALAVMAITVGLLAPTAGLAAQQTDDKMAQDKMSGDKMSADKMSKDKMSHKKKKKSKKKDSMMSTESH